MKRTRQATIITVAAVGALLLFGATADIAAAHGVNVFAWVEGDTVHVESKFSGGRKVKDGKVVVRDLHGNDLLTGTTDAEGKFDFTVPRLTDLKIVLIAGMGHRGEWTVPAAEIEAAAAGGISSPGGEGTKTAEPAEAPAAPSPPTEPRSLAVEPDLEAVEAAVEKALDRKLKPVLQMLAESRQTGPTLKDIFGGIGYILGLVGVAAWVQSRKKS